VYSTVDSDITYLIHGLVDCLERLVVCAQSSVKKVVVNASADTYRMLLKLT